MGNSVQTYNIAKQTVVTTRLKCKLLMLFPFHGSPHIDQLNPGGPTVSNVIGFS